MSLADLIHGNGKSGFATAKVAIRATEPEGNETAIAKVATLTIANTETAKAELIRLVRLCGERYHFTEAEHTEALAMALADPESALTCYRNIATKLL